MRSYLSFDNRRGNTYGAGLKDGSDVHTRGWHAGVEVTVRYTGPKNETDVFHVYMTSGSNGGGCGSTYLGTVTETPDGPRWDPSADAQPSRSRKLAAARAELATVREQIAAARAELDDVPAAARAELDDVPAAARAELADITARIAERRRQLAGMPERSADEDHPGIARAALQTAIDTLLGVDCTFWACEGPDVTPESMKTCSVCWKIHDLRAELARLDAPRITTTPSESGDM